MPKCSFPWRGLLFARKPTPNDKGAAPSVWSRGKVRANWPEDLSYMDRRAWKDVYGVAKGRKENEKGALVPPAAGQWDS